MAVERQHAETEIRELAGARCEKLIASPGAVSDAVCVVYLKANGRWHRFFLDAGLLLWTEAPGPSADEELVEGESYVDLLQDAGPHTLIQLIRMEDGCLTVRLSGARVLRFVDEGETKVLRSW